MKVAAVVGRTFRAPVLPGAYAELGDARRGARPPARAPLGRGSCRSTARPSGVDVRPRHDPGGRIRSLPFAMRSILHARIGAFIERSEADDLERWIPLLEHHYWRSDHEDQKRRISPGRRRRPKQATRMRRRSITTPAPPAGRGRGAGRGDDQVRERPPAHRQPPAGGGDRARGALARGCAGRPGAGRPLRPLAGQSARRVGRYDEAITRLGAASAAFRAVGDDLGVAAALQIIGTVNAQRGDLETARATYLESLDIRERLGDLPGVAALTNNLGVVALHSGDLEGARVSGERALALYASGDRRRICSARSTSRWWPRPQGTTRPPGALGGGGAAGARGRRPPEPRDRPEQPRRRAPGTSGATRRRGRPTPRRS